MKTIDIQNINSLQFRSKVEKGKPFKVTKFVLSFYPYGSIWYRNLIYFLQFFILFPVALVLDLVLWLSGKIFELIFGEFKDLYKRSKDITFKLIYDLFKALVKPFAVLTSIFVFCLFVYSLIKDISIYDAFKMVYIKLF